MGSSRLTIIDFWGSDVFSSADGKALAMRGGGSGLPHDGGGGQRQDGD